MLLAALFWCEVDMTPNLMRGTRSKMTSDNYPGCNTFHLLGTELSAFLFIHVLLGGNLNQWKHEDLVQWSQ
jgi:hypothetical protein